MLMRHSSGTAYSIGIPGCVSHKAYLTIILAGLLSGPLLGMLLTAMLR